MWSFWKRLRSSHALIIPDFGGAWLINDGSYDFYYIREFHSRCSLLHYDPNS